MKSTASGASPRRPAAAPGAPPGPAPTGGAGIEALITQSLTLRLEYRYTDLGRFSESVPISTVCAGTCGSPSSAASISLHPTFQAVRVGVGYNF